MIPGALFMLTDIQLLDQVIAYFCERMISEETLRRNGVMRLLGDKVP